VHSLLLQAFVESISDTAVSTHEQVDGLLGKARSMVGSVDSCPDISEARWAMLVVAYDNISDRITTSMCPGLKQAMHEVEFSESGRSFKRAWGPKTTEVGVNALATMCALEDQVTMCIAKKLESNKYNKIRSAILNSLKCKQIFDRLTWKSECRILQHLSRVADHVHEDPDALSSATLDALCATMSDLASEVERVMSKQGDANCYISNIKTFVESWKSTLVGPSKARFGELLLPNMDPEKLLVSLDVEELRKIQPCKHRIVERMESYAVLSGGLSLGETFDVPFAQWSLCLNNTRIEVAQAFVAANHIDDGSLLSKAIEDAVRAIQAANEAVSSIESWEPEGLGPQQGKARDTAVAGARKKRLAQFEADVADCGKADLLGFKPESLTKVQGDGVKKIHCLNSRFTLNIVRVRLFYY
jgi:hypothetical protein